MFCRDRETPPAPMMLSMRQIVVQPSLDTIREVLAAASTFPNPPNLVPVFSSIPAEFLTPSSIYLKVSAK
jgi:anthranilate synthase component 1